MEKKRLKDEAAMLHEEVRAKHNLDPINPLADNEFLMITCIPPSC